MWSRAIILLSAFGAVSNYMCSSFFGSKISLSLSLVTDGPPVPPSTSSSSGYQTSMLRRPPISTDDDPVGRPKFTQPSPRMWSDIPILPPHTGHKKVLVTGAAGFIGSHVAEALLERGDEVIVVDDMNDYYDVSIKEGNLNLLRDKAKTIARQQANKQASKLAKQPAS